MNRPSSIHIAVVIACALLLAACGGAATQAPAAAVPETQAPATAMPATQAPAATVPAPTVPPAAAQKETIAVALPAMDNPLMLALRDAFVNTFGDKYNVEVASADGNPNTQATQVENYTAMNVKFMFVMAAEASSLLPKLEAARKAGIKVMVAGGEPSVILFV